MIDALIKALGLQMVSSYELAVATMIASMIALLLGIAIDGLSERTSFGPFFNAAMLGGFVVAGLWLARQFPALSTFGGLAVFAAAVGFASLAFITLSFAKMRITR